MNMNMKMLGRKKSCLLLTFSVLSSSYWLAISAQQDPSTDPQEVSALLAIRHHLKDPLKNLWNWKRKTDPCITNWNGVICTRNLTDGYQHVQELRLFRYNLSGTMAPELGKLSKMSILDFMWNNISGSIPKEIGKITALEHLLLSGNQISGPLPDELGDLPNLLKFQLDLNYISGPIPESFAKLPKVKHFHMNNNSISGQIPPVLYKLPQLQHFLLDNNNLSGYLPEELSQMQGLTIFQLDNNNFEGSIIPESYGNMTKLFKLSLTNCNLRGTIPDLSQIRNLLYLDLSGNQLTGNIPSSKLSDNITTIDLSNNQLNGSIPLNFTGFLRLQNLSLSNNYLSGSIPSNFWRNRSFTSDEKLILKFENNRLSDISGILDTPPNVTLKLSGNPICTIGNGQNISLFCGSKGSSEAEKPPFQFNKTDPSSSPCAPQSCPTTDHFEYVPSLPNDCFCSLPFGVELRLRSPSISDFPPYRPRFENFIAKNVHIDLSQLDIESVAWEKRRLRLFLKFFPTYSPNGSHTFSNDEVQRIANLFATFNFSSDEIFGPYDLLNFTLHGPYATVLIFPSKGGVSKGALTGIVLGSVFGAIGILWLILLVYWKRCQRNQDRDSKDQLFSKIAIKIEGVKAFSFKEMELATSSFSNTNQIGQGGYGKVYKGILADGTVVAIKRAQQGSLQGENEFYTEMELLSCLHHRNLVSLVGYCDEKSEQMLVYEFMPRGSVHDLLSARYTEINFGTRLQIALGSARGILYLHREADPPIIHRDIKATNILLDSKYNAKVSDFGLSKRAPLPDEKGNTASHVSTVVKGTPGYLDPEYFLTHKLTEKSDVYSLGIVFLELLTGMQPISHGRNIVREVNAACESGTMFSIIDRNMGACSTGSIKKFMALALRCSRDQTEGRPSVLEVVRELENIASLLPKVKKKNETEEEETLVSSASRMSTTNSTPSTRSSPRKNPNYVSMDFPGSDLISDVVPSIKPC